MKQDSIIVVKVEKVGRGEEVPLPVYMTEGSVGADLFSAVDEVLRPSEFKVIPTGIKIALPDGYEAQIRPRSGLAARFGVTVLNSPGTVDSDYRGEIKVVLINLGKDVFHVRKGDRIAQMVIHKVERVCFKEVESLPSTNRGEGGFGCTGVR